MNSTVTDRKRLIVDPGEHTISGINSQSKALNGHFMDIEVYLGELKTDEKGRLIVLEVTENRVLTMEAKR